jgi:hypothetical protein
MITETRMMTGKFRVSFPAVFAPTAFENQEPKYAVTMLFDPGDETLAMMKKVAGEIGRASCRERV